MEIDEISYPYEYRDAYNEILEAVKKYESFCVFDLKKMEFDAECHMLGLDLKHLYGFDIDPKIIKSTDFFRFNDYVSIGLYGGESKRTISWEDNGMQPENERLLVFSFPTGPYIFGNYSDDDYPKDFFNEFFAELKSYEPKYIDTANKCLYFSMDKAGRIFNEFPVILKKYYYKNKDDIKARKIKKMEEDLARLKNNHIGD